jgi:uncharacterized protein (DUF302 family)
MIMNNNFIKIILAFLLSANLANNAHATEPENIHGLMVYEVESAFELARDDLVSAIKARGMVISYIAHAKDMLDRTADAIGVSIPAYKTGAEIVLFCKSDISHRLTQANPHYIGLCPYAISVYDIQDAEGKVFFNYRKLPKDIKESAEIEAMLKSIIEEVIENL